MFLFFLFVCCSFAALQEHNFGLHFSGSCDFSGTGTCFLQAQSMTTYSFIGPHVGVYYQENVVPLGVTANLTLVPKMGTPPSFTEHGKLVINDGSSFSFVGGGFHQNITGSSTVQAAINTMLFRKQLEFGQTALVLLPQMLCSRPKGS